MKKWMWCVTIAMGLCCLVATQRALAAPAADGKAPAAGAPAAGAPADAPAPSLELTTSDAKAAAAKPKEDVAKMDFYHIVFRAGWFGVLIWMSLFVSSIVCVALIVDSYMNIRKTKVAPQSIATSVSEAIAEGDVLKAMQNCEETPTPLSTILLAGLHNVAEGFETVQDAVSLAADLEGEKLLERVTYLSVISNTTPMLGLIGTVQGMIFAFFTMATMEAGAAQQAMLAVNISHGLWATAVGLGVSVPAAIYYFYFKNKATKILLGMEALTMDTIKVLRNVEVVQD